MGPRLCALDANGNALALGVSMDKDALAGLPKEPNRTSRCFDKNGNGKMDEHECPGTLPSSLRCRRERRPRRSRRSRVSLNWNPHGHIPRPAGLGRSAFRFPLLHPGAGGGEASGPAPGQRSTAGLQEATKAVRRSTFTVTTSTSAPRARHGQSPDQFQGTGAREEGPAVHARVHLRRLRRSPSWSR